MSRARPQGAARTTQKEKNSPLALNLTTSTEPTHPPSKTGKALKRRSTPKITFMFVLATDAASVFLSSRSQLSVVQVLIDCNVERDAPCVYRAYVHRRCLHAHISNTKTTIRAE